MSRRHEPGRGSRGLEKIIGRRVEMVLPAGFETWSEEERLTWCGKEMLAEMQELCGEMGLPAEGPLFAVFVDGAPLTDRMRRAISLARKTSLAP